MNLTDLCELVSHLDIFHHHTRGMMLLKSVKREEQD